MFTHITIKRIESSGCLGIKVVSEMTMLWIQEGSLQVVFLFFHFDLLEALKM